MILEGTIETTYISMPSFTAGRIRLEDGMSARFAGKACLGEGEYVQLIGDWKNDKKYGKQFAVTNVKYDMPVTENGLRDYIAKSPAFCGIGPKYAERIVQKYGTALPRLLGEGLTAEEVAANCELPLKNAKSFLAGWKSNEEVNDAHSYLSGFELTPHQIRLLIDTHGESVIGTLQRNPYALIEMMEGFGFKRVDDIARKLGAQKNDPHRIRAAVSYGLSEEVRGGNSITSIRSLCQRTEKILNINNKETRKQIGDTMRALVTEKKMALVQTEDTNYLTTYSLLQSELAIQDAFDGGRADNPHRDKLVPAFDGLTEGQAAAMRMACQHAGCLISGAAGSGKTFVVGRLTKAYQDAGLSVTLCAPTGKAAKRMEEVLRDQHNISIEASTIHRLLGYTGVTYKADEIHADVVIVDESSMVDVQLGGELFGRIDPRKTAFVLVGDHNQLPPVGPGNILRDIMQCELLPYHQLTHVVRQAGLLKQNSCDILDGKVAKTPRADGAKPWYLINKFKEPEHIQRYIGDLYETTIPETLGYDSRTDVQIITAVHKGPLGTMELNQRIQSLVHNGHVNKKYMVGDKVIQCKNDYEVEVMNGTIGYVTSNESDGYHVLFDGKDDPIVVSGEKLQHLRLAYALTAHKAQGSEFPCVIVVAHKRHFFASHRNWLYTAVTRASQTCIIIGDQWGICQCASNSIVDTRETILGIQTQEISSGGITRDYGVN